MKTIKQFFLAILMTSTLVACSSDDDGGENGDAAEGTITASIDGASFTSSDILTSATVVTANGTSTVLITGSDLGGKNLTLNVSGGFEGVGTYEIGGGANVFVNASYTEVDANNPMDAQIWSAPFDDTVAGELNVSASSDSNITGTFSFMAKNPDDNSIKNITSGSFNINL